MGINAEYMGVPDSSEPSGEREVLIAGQCCMSDSTNTAQAKDVCRRFQPEIGNNDAGCIAGHVTKGTLVPMTFRQIESRCAEIGLQLCHQSCKGRGCYYNRHPVWSGIECNL